MDKRKNRTGECAVKQVLHMVETPCQQVPGAKTSLPEQVHTSVPAASSWLPAAKTWQLSLCVGRMEFMLLIEQFRFFLTEAFTKSRQIKKPLLVIQDNFCSTSG